MPSEARIWRVTGRVQGVGFRAFVRVRAAELGLTGWVRNEADGSVSAYAVGEPETLDRLSGYLRMGPRMAMVRGVDQRTAPAEKLSSFRQE